MILLKATIAGFRSIREPVELHLDPSVTVVLGANDHGKSNLLQALLHLNPDNAFSADRDLNWDSSDRSRFPSVTYELELSDEERKMLRENERRFREQGLLEEFLAAANEDIAKAQETVTEAQAELASAREILSATSEKLDAAEIASVASPDDSAVQLSVANLQSDTANAATAVESAELAADAADQRLHQAAKKATVAAAAAFVAEQIAAGRTADSAVPAEQARLGEQLKGAMTALTKAEERADEAASAFSAGKASYAEGTEEYVRLEKVVNSARAAKRRAERDVDNLKATLDRLAEYQDALKRHQAADTEWHVPDLPSADPMPLNACPTKVSLSRTGVDGRLALDETSLPSEVLEGFVFERLPRVELIQPADKIPDSVNRKSLESDSSVFMRGIFHYAGLASEEWDDIFAQTDVTTRRLTDASETLNERLRESWSQGRRLAFVLRHDSATKRIDLLIKDPAVTQQYVRASKRSSGFTHFFALKTVLNAHQHEAPAASYIWVFDEPGVYLHPDGQHDLVQVMETLSRTNQVVYSTHSIFMANKNFPARHRLVLKTKSGSKLDGKPFRSRWRPAIDALGMSMPGTLLFASRVLLVEGDSDSILLNAVLQKLIEMRQFDRDVNTLAIMSAGDAPDAAAVVRILKESNSAPTVAALFDGDDGGQKRERALEELERTDLEIKRLTPAETTTEDHLPAALDLYPRALAAYLAKMAPRRNAEGERLSEDDYLALILARIDELEQSTEGLTTGLAGWARKVGKEVGELNDKPSPVGVAREYTIILSATPAEDLRSGQKLRRARELAKWIAKTLDLPEMILREDEILVGDEDAEDLV